MPPFGCFSITKKKDSTMADLLPLPAENSTLHPDNDDVALTYGTGDVGFITFSLSTSSNIDWWKGVKVFGNGTWTTIGLLETQDEDHGPSERKIEIGKFTGPCRVELWKAKSFGVHTDVMNYSFDADKLSGKKVGFLWKKD
jgi:hypothetical protein